MSHHELFKRLQLVATFTIVQFMQGIVNDFCYFLIFIARKQKNTFLK